MIVFEYILYHCLLEADYKNVYNEMVMKPIVPEPMLRNVEGRWNEMSETNEPKKINLADAIKQKLAQKKAQQSEQKNQFNGAGGTKKLVTQNNKKPNNQRRRTGGS